MLQAGAAPEAQRGACAKLLRGFVNADSAPLFVRANALLPLLAMVQSVRRDARNGWAPVASARKAAAAMADEALLTLGRLCEVVDGWLAAEGWRLDEGWEDKSVPLWINHKARGPVLAPSPPPAYPTTAAAQTGRPGTSRARALSAPPRCADGRGE